MKQQTLPFSESVLAALNRLPASEGIPYWQALVGLMLVMTWLPLAMLVRLAGRG